MKNQQNLEKSIKRGRCIVCNRETTDRQYFQDTPEDPQYLEWCCDACFEYLEERI